MLIKDGTIVTASEEFRGDILVEGESIHNALRIMHGM